MKIMFVASNPDEAADLTLEREITELQRRFLAVAGDPVEFITFPGLPIEDLPIEISKHHPDVLHISAHGDGAELTLSNESGESVALSEDVLRAYLDIDRPPRLVYLNACNSRTIAADLVRLVPLAIGTTAPISNRTARASAILFYDRLLSGASVQNAFEAGRAAIKTLQHAAAFRTLLQADVFPQTERLHQIPQIMARFAEGNVNPDRDGYFDIEMGVFGCPGNTSQVVFFTDDYSFINEEELQDPRDEYEIAGHLCRVVRSSPTRNVIWSEWSERVFGDYRACVAGVTSAGGMFAVSANLCDALEACFRHIAGADKRRLVPKQAQLSIAQLRSMDGSGPPTGDASRVTRKVTRTAGTARRVVRKAPGKSAAIPETSRGRRPKGSTKRTRPTKR